MTAFIATLLIMSAAVYSVKQYAVAKVRHSGR